MHAIVFIQRKVFVLLSSWHLKLWVVNVWAWKRCWRCYCGSKLQGLRIVVRDSTWVISVAQSLSSWGKFLLNFWFFYDIGINIEDDFLVSQLETLKFARIWRIRFRECVKIGSGYGSTLDKVRQVINVAESLFFIVAESSGMTRTTDKWWDWWQWSNIEEGYIRMFLQLRTDLPFTKPSFSLPSLNAFGGGAKRKWPTPFGNSSSVKGVGLVYLWRTELYFNQNKMRNDCPYSYMFWKTIKFNTFTLLWKAEKNLLWLMVFFFFQL